MISLYYHTWRFVPLDHLTFHNQWFSGETMPNVLQGLTVHLLDYKAKTSQGGYKSVIPAVRTLSQKNRELQVQSGLYRDQVLSLSTVGYWQDQNS